MSATRTRCKWAGNDPLMQAYHDEEWGMPDFDSRSLWETLMLEGFQAGLSWITILKKRDAFRAAFDQFDPDKVARYGEAERARLMADAGIVRSNAKVDAAIAVDGDHAVAVHVAAPQPPVVPTRPLGEHEPVCERRQRQCHGIVQPAETAAAASR